jgi:hypothetical protein
MNLSTTFSFIKTHWRPVLACLAVVLSFVGGRWLAPTPPAKIEIQEKVVEKIVEKEVIKVVEKLVVDQKVVEAEVQKRMKDLETSVDKIITRTTTTKPDGTIISTETIEVHKKKKETVIEIKYVDRVVETKVFVDRVVEKVVDRVVEVVVEKKTVIDNRKDWRVGVLVGAQPTFLPVPNLGALSFGGEVERRIVGPVWLGAWGISNGSMGLKAGIDF